MPRTVTAVYTDFPPGGKRWRLPLGKTQSVASIAYRTVGGTAIITGPSSGSPEGTDWEEDLTSDNGGILWSDSWPSPVTSSLAPVRVTFTAGWADADQVPADVKTGLVACIADLLETVTSDEGRNVLIKHNQAEAILSAWRIARV